MAKLVLSMDGLVLKEIALNKERISLGRKAHNDIQIDNLAISGEHAVIITLLNDSFLEDLNSTNGTLVNGQVVKKHFLKNGDVIELGKYKLKYFGEQIAQDQASEFEKTMVLRPNITPKLTEQTTSYNAQPREANSPGDTHTEQFIPAPRQTENTTMAPKIGVVQILSGANTGRELELTKTLTTLGKPGVQVAVIAKRPHGYFLTHVEGTQYPIINGKVLDAQAQALQDHDVIEITGVKMEFFLKG
ncbi:MAG: FHA domain-containing protein [Pseudomonadota bacterium]